MRPEDSGDAPRGGAPASGCTMLVMGLVGALALGLVGLLVWVFVS